MVNSCLGKYGEAATLDRQTFATDKDAVGFDV
jgi:hypothetical protein